MKKKTSHKALHFIMVVFLKKIFHQIRKSGEALVNTYLLKIIVSYETMPNPTDRKNGENYQSYSFVLSQHRNKSIIT